ncbi:hypothetical protein NUACC21_35920 [Scytonema sp. NUACC21]
MKFFDISYDLNTSRKNYQALHDAIKTFGDWFHCQRSVWLIRSSLSEKQIYDRLRAHTSDLDYLSVFEVNLSSALGWLPKIESTKEWTLSTSAGCFADADFLSDFDDRTED